MVVQFQEGVHEFLALLATRRNVRIFALGPKDMTRGFTK
jgi:hypothetical protein